MTILERDPDAKPQIDLCGPEGNAFFLLHQANFLAVQLGRDPEPILKRMKSGDYENLIQVFDEEFGMYIDLVR